MKMKQLHDGLIVSRYNIACTYEIRVSIPSSRASSVISLQSLSVIPFLQSWLAVLHQLAWTLEWILAVVRAVLS